MRAVVDANFRPQSEFGHRGQQLNPPPSCALVKILSGKVDAKDFFTDQFFQVTAISDNVSVWDSIRKTK